MRRPHGGIIACLLALASVARDPPCGAQPPGASAQPASCPAPLPSLEGVWTDHGAASITFVLHGSSLGVTLTQWNVPGPFTLVGADCSYTGHFTTRRVQPVDPGRGMQEQVYEGEARLTITSPDTLVLHVEGRSYPAGRARVRVYVNEFQVTSTLHRRPAE